MPLQELKKLELRRRERMGKMESRKPSLRNADTLSHLFLVEEIKYQHNRFFGTETGTTDVLAKLCNSKEGDLYFCFRPFLILGRILGIVPITGLWNNSNDLKKISFKWDSLAMISTIPILSFLSASAIFSFLYLFKEFAGSGGSNASQMAVAARSPLFYSMSVFVYSFFLIRSNTLVQLFSRWQKVTQELGFVEKDIKLFKHINIIAAMIFISGMIENWLFIAHHFPVEQLDQDQLLLEVDLTPLETYFWRAHKSWGSYISYNPVLAIILLLVDFIAWSSWNYADIFIVLCSRALYFKFKILVDQTERHLLSKENRIFDKVNGQTWAQVRKDHLSLCKLLDEFEVLLSPLIFVSYSMNIFFICLQLHEGLTPQEHTGILHSAFSSWSFAHLVFRILSVSLTAAKVNEYAHEITTCVQKCSTTEYCKELERLERMLATGPIGLSGLGCFVITRAFLLMVVSVIFTVEIVLLQASASSSPGSFTSTPRVTSTAKPL